MGKRLDKIEKWTGNIMVAILIGIVVFSFLATIFRLLFRDGKGIPSYGNRGDSYIYDDYRQ